MLFSNVGSSLGFKNFFFIYLSERERESMSRGWGGERKEQTSH